MHTDAELHQLDIPARELSCSDCTAIGEIARH
jgi:hypothetical protein